MILEFDNYRIDTKELKLAFLGRELDVEPAVLRVLAFLVENREKVVTRDLIFSQVWTNRFVSDSALTNHIKNARKILGDNGCSQNMIKTIHGRGYQFVCPVNEITSYKVAVLPITNTSPEQPLRDINQPDYLGIALASHLVAELSHFTQLRIHSGNCFQGSEQLRNEYICTLEDQMVDFVIAGNYAEHQTTTRFFIKLISNNSQLIVWSKSIEMERSSIFDVQDFISSIVCEAVAIKLKLSFGAGYNQKETHESLAASKSSRKKRAHLTLL